MNKCYVLISLLIAACYVLSIAEPNGAVLYRNGKRLGHINVPSTAAHHYFGYLEGPAWENKYCAFRYYIDQDDRNALDIIGKLKEEAILQHFSDTSVDEHASWPWGTDIFKINSSIGLGAFRLYLNNSWLNPQIPENLDSLVVTILDSSVQTPKVQIGYHGWNIGSGNKVTVVWTITTTLNERPTHCEVAITGNYTGKVVVGLTNHRDNTGNPNRTSVKLIQDEDPPLLATLGKQGGLSEGFADTLLLAVFADKSYFDSFVKDGTVNYGMALKLDADKKAKWSLAYSWAREVTPLFRDPNWKNVLTNTTASRLHAPRISPVQGNQSRIFLSTQAATLSFSDKAKSLAVYALNGREIVRVANNPQVFRSAAGKMGKGAFIVKEE